MHWFFLIIPILGFSGLIFTKWRLRKKEAEHNLKIEQMKKKVVELEENQLVLFEKIQLANRFKNSSEISFEKLNKEISGLFDLLMKITNIKDHKKE